MARSLLLRPPAKINLMLRVGPRRPDGFHEVRTLLQSIALSDAMTVTVRSGPFVLSTRGPGVPADRTNLVWRAAELLWQALGRPGDARDVHVKLEKHIPSQAGLGGGSSDAAAMLAALNMVWEGGLSRRRLSELGRELGSDVPFFLHGGTAIGVGRGDELYPVDDIKRLGLVVIKPSFGVATAEAYRWIDEDAAVDGRHPHVGADVDVGWSSGPISLGNDFEPAVGRRHAAVGEMVDACRRAGAVAAGMTGSGSAVFGLFSESATRAAARRLQRPDWLVLVTRTLNRREAGRRVGL